MKCSYSNGGTTTLPKFAFVLVILLLLSVALPATAQKNSQPPTRFTERVQKEVIHKILMLPNYDAFDSISFKVEGYSVVLLGYVTQPYLKSDAERAVKKIEGVERVDNRIAVLPLSPNDDRLRAQLFRAIYGYGPLQRYALPPIKPIRIVVDRGPRTIRRRGGQRHGQKPGQHSRQRSPRSIFRDQQFGCAPQEIKEITRRYKAEILG
jgi:hypothetical protein